MLPKGSMYSLKYNKHTIVKALPGTFGIMVFRTESRASVFSRGITRVTIDNIHILKVRPIGRNRKIRALSVFNRNDATDNTHIFKNFYKFYHAQENKKKWWLIMCNLMNVPYGTECYPAVEVLE